MSQFLEKHFDLNQKALATRASFGNALVELGKKNEQIMVLDADLSCSTQTQHFAKEFPKRFFNMGIAEANMIGTAAGLARAGKIPFAASFGCFLTGRFDQIRMSVSFTDVPVRLIGTHAGVGIGEDGHSQMALEDIGLMRSLPNMTVFQPADDFETRNFMEWSLGVQSPCYMRLTRQGLAQRKRGSSDQLKVGHWDFLEEAQAEGGLCFVGSGSMLENMIRCADLIPNQAVKNNLTLVNAQWLKPVAEENFQRILSKKPKYIVSFEDHYTNCGVGTILAEAMAASGEAVKLRKIGVEDFGQSGSPAANMKGYAFDPESLLKRLTDWNLL